MMMMTMMMMMMMILLLLLIIIISMIPKMEVAPHAAGLPTPQTLPT